MYPAAVNTPPTTTECKRSVKSTCQELIAEGSKHRAERTQKLEENLVRETPLKIITERKNRFTNLYDEAKINVYK